MVSGEIPPEIIKEIEKFERAIGDYLAQKISDAKFQRIRLQHGIYGQRQEGVQMVRIKIPFGGLTARQFEAIADVCERYSRGIAHLTTRQDIQIHYVEIANVPAIVRVLAGAGVTTREACGNTVRNVTACPYAGVSVSEPFDVTPYARAFAYHMLRNPICQNMGRKFKVAFEGCDRDHARLRVHDIGFQARVKKGKRGFQVFTGGGLGATPHVARLFYDFMPEEELLSLGEAIVRVFDRYGERRIRSKARMKFLIKKFGFGKFKELVEAERKSLHTGPHWNDYLKTVEQPWETPRHPVVGKEAPETEAYRQWRQTNVCPQRQKGYSVVIVRRVVGDMVPSQMRSLATLARRYAGGQLRTSIEQNMILRWVHDEDLASLYEELTKINMAAPHAETLYDITACPGTDTCRLGIAASIPLAKVLEERLAAEDGAISKYANDLRIKISGCPNSCGQHHLGNIGFHGGALPQAKHTVPAFQLMLGGGVGPKGTSIAQIITKIPSKNVPEATVLLIKHYDAHRKKGESFNDFYARLGRRRVEELLADLVRAPAYEEKPDFYTDWGDKKEFALQQGVIGECAGSTVSDVVPQLSDAKPALEQARALLTHGEYASATAKAYEAVVQIADAALYARMVQTFEPEQSIFSFENHFVKTGTMPELADFEAKVNGWRAQADQEGAMALVAHAEKMLSLCGRRLAAHAAA